jgi:hypothetical protein
MNPLATLAIGWYRTGKLQGWIRLLASCLVTAFVTFFGTFGLIVGALVNSGGVNALVIGLAAASTAMALSVLSLWLRSPLTKGIPILYPGKIEAARLTQLTDDGIVYNPNEKR